MLHIFTLTILPLSHCSSQLTDEQRKEYVNKERTFKVGNLDELPEIPVIREICAKLEKDARPDRLNRGFSSSNQGNAIEGWAGKVYIQR